jgi:hypothetical protein
METAAADLVAVAEIMRARAVLAADAAWAAADLAVVVVVVVAAADVVEEDVVAAEDVDAKHFDDEKHNENKNKYYDFVETLHDHCGDG